MGGRDLDGTHYQKWKKNVWFILESFYSKSKEQEYNKILAT